MVTDKNGTPIEHLDIVLVDRGSGHGYSQPYTALVTRNLHGELIVCSPYGLSRIESDVTVKVDHFPSKRYHLPRSVEKTYMLLLKSQRNSIDNQILNFVKTTNSAKAGDIDG